MDANVEQQKFHKQLSESLVLHADRSWIDELTEETRPVFLAFSSSESDRSFSRSHSEGCALLTLFGRRVGACQLSPTGVFAVGTALFERMRVSPLVGDGQRLFALFLEGVFAGMKEVEQSELQAKQQASVPLRLLYPGCLLLTLSGSWSSDSLARVNEKVGAWMLREPVGALVVDSLGLAEAARDRVVELLSVRDVARFMGAKVTFAGPPEEWKVIARDLRISLPAEEFFDSLAHAVVGAETAGGFELRRRGGWMRWLGAF